jgi:AhpD family alkylhydroperoxidase
MARVESKRGLLVRFGNWYVKRKYGREVAVTDVVAQSRANAIGYSMLEFWHERAHALDGRIKDLAATKVATIVGCQFCIDIGSHLSREAGVTEEQLRDFHDYRTSAAFSEEEKIAMEYAEQMTERNVQIADDFFARLREHFSDEQLVELTMAIAVENLRARFNNALDIPAAGFSEGAYCPLPEREVATVTEPAQASASEEAAASAAARS